ncbi:MAG: hypothetical protein Q8K75_03240 [Chlamydiales bacterium]|nr:hypothetical protein [Chlamydiales bacterium]
MSVMAVAASFVNCGPVPAPVKVPLTTSLSRKLDMVLDITFNSFVNVLPDAIQWVYLRHIWRSIKAETITVTVGKVTSTARLYFHDTHAKKRGVLFLHGDHSHPYSMLRLARLAQKEGAPVFSVWVSYDHKNSELHRQLIRKSIERVSGVMKARGGIPKVVGVGHSQGCAQLFLAMRSLSSIIAIAGRFKLFEESPDRQAVEALKPTIREVQGKIRPWHPIYQIAAGRDWCIRPDAQVTQAAPKSFVVPNAMHLSVVYDQLAQNKYVEYLRTAIAA